MRLRRHLLSLAAAIALTAAAVVSSARAEAPDAAQVADTYGDIALAMYEARSRGEGPPAAVGVLAEPTDEELAAAKEPGRRRACPTSRTRAIASACIVDDWEEGERLDARRGRDRYVSTIFIGESEENTPLCRERIANAELRIVPTWSTPEIKPALLSEQLLRRRAWRRTSPPAITPEFLLWGQDLPAPRPQASGGKRLRPAECTNGN